MTLRLVLIADTHAYHHELLLPPGDVLIAAGDVTQHGERAELDDFLSWFSAQPHPHKLLIAGNHDHALERLPDVSALLASQGIIWLHERLVVIEEVRFWGASWVQMSADWAFSSPTGHIARERWEKLPEGLDVLITHTPARGMGDRGHGGARYGCAALSERLEALEHPPRLHAFGHVHECGGLWAEGGRVSCNVTTWEAERHATVIDYFTASRRAVPVRVPERETTM